ncbi:hypothetical protein HBA54_06325 [Pelagibius litoralis]|uniref:JmjC domain-containing protein n=1 Tax=Pelagibius litoralis TaxID=374515 RepID=A0A967CBA5_9PROT|nr:cupin domain-containing protein [Pelagibius litoralis]NIA68203.1 hypothetical protein [Pelagibius litoralis]
MTDLFDSFLAPLDQAAFFAETQGKGHRHFPGKSARTADIMTLQRLNELMSMTSVWTPETMKLYLDLQPVAPADYCTRVPTMQGGGALRPDPDLVQNWIAKGASVILNDIDALSPGVRALANDLQTATGGRSQANLYFSMHQHKAFGPHCDVHEVFALHCAGEKIWNIYEGRDEAPVNHPDFKPSDAERARRAGKVIDQVHMKPGDLLYIPRGVYHDALASANGAIHIAFGVTLPKPLDLLPIIWDAAIKNPWMRADLPRDMAPAELKDALGKMGEAIAGALSSEGARKVAAAALENWPYAFKGYDLARLVDAESGEQTQDDTSYAVSKQVKITRHNGKPYLSDGKQQVEVPGDVARQVDFIMGCERFTEASLRAAFPEMSDAAVTELLRNMKSMRAIA